jgi:hypothetical protein
MKAWIIGEIIKTELHGKTSLWLGYKRNPEIFNGCFSQKAVRTFSISGI